MVGVDLHGQYKTRTGDCGLQTTDYGLGVKHRLMCKTRTKHYGLGINCTRTQVLPLLKGDQFHAYLTAQAQNAFPRIFVFLTY